MTSRPQLWALTAALTLFAVSPVAAQEPSFGDLTQTAGTGSGQLVPGRDFPMLEFDSKVRLLSDKAEMFLHENGTRKFLGILDQNAGMALHDAYRFRATAESDEAARIDFLDFTADAGVKIALTQPGLRGREMGRIRQRALFSIGTGIDVYVKGDLDKSFGYVDQKAGATLGRDILRDFASFGLATPDKAYTFYKVTYETETYLTKWRKKEKTRIVPVKTPILHFTTGMTSGTGPGGLFMDPSGKPILAIKGDWWVSQNIFDLLVRKVDNEGTAGKTLRGLGALLQAADGDLDGAADTLGEGQEFVRNSSAYLGSFLIGLVYFPEFQRQVGVSLPIQAR